MLPTQQIQDTMKKIKLNNLASIRAGYSARTRLTRGGSGGIRVIRPADVSVWQPVDYSALQTMAIEPRNVDSHCLKPGELLFFGRSGQIFSVLLEDVPDRIIAAGSFLVLTVHSGPSLLLPHYLNWYLNSSQAKDFLQRITGGSVLIVVTKSALHELLIPVPPLSVQEQIAKAWQLLLEEKELTMERLRLREEMVNQAIDSAIRGKDDEA